MLPQFGAADEISSSVKRQRTPSVHLPPSSPPRTVIFCHDSSFVSQFLQHTPHQTSSAPFSKLHLLTDHPGLAIADFGHAASMIASKMEELIQWGVAQFISIATAGTLQPKAQVGDLIVCEKAVRDETTSNQYLPSTKYIHAPRRMTNKLQQAFKKADLPYHIGSTWTTDRFCQQVETEAPHYQQEGVISIDMGAASLFAVAHFYQVDLGALFTISGSLIDLLWHPHHEDPRVQAGLSRLLQIAIEAAQDKT